MNGQRESDEVEVELGGVGSKDESGEDVPGLPLQALAGEAEDDAVLNNDVTGHEVLQDEPDLAEEGELNVLAPLDFPYEGEVYSDYDGKTTSLTTPEEVQQAQLLYYCAARNASVDERGNELLAEKLGVPYGVVKTWSNEDKCSAQTVVAELERTPVTVVAMNRWGSEASSLGEFDRLQAIELSVAGYVEGSRKATSIEPQLSPVELNGLEDPQNEGRRVLRRDLDLSGITVDDREVILWREPGDHYWNELNDDSDDAFTSSAIEEADKSLRLGDVVANSFEHAGYRHKRNLFVNRLRGAHLRRNSLEDALNRGERVLRRDLELSGMTIDDREVTLWREIGDQYWNELRDDSYIAYASPAQIDEMQAEDRKEIADLAQSIAQASQEMANISLPSKESDPLMAKMNSLIMDALKDAPGDLAGMAIEAFAGPAGPVLSAIVSGAWARYTEYEVGFMVALASYGVDITDAKKIEAVMMNREMGDKIHQRAQRFADDKAFLSLLGSAASSVIKLPIGAAPKGSPFYDEGYAKFLERVQSLFGKSVENFVEKVGELYLDTDLKLHSRPGAQELEAAQNWLRSQETEEAAAIADKLMPILELTRQGEQTNRENRLIKEFNDFFLASELRSKDLQTYEQFVRETGARYGIDMFYINAQTLVDEIPEVKDELLRLSPVLDQQLAEAYRAGGLVAFPIEEYARIITPKLAEALRRYMTLNPKSLSLAEFEFLENERLEAKQAAERSAASHLEALESLKDSGIPNVPVSSPNSWDKNGMDDVFGGFSQMR